MLASSAKRNRGNGEEGEDEEVRRSSRREEKEMERGKERECEWKSKEWMLTIWRGQSYRITNLTKQPNISRPFSFSLCISLSPSDRSNESKEKKWKKVILIYVRTRSRRSLFCLSGRSAFRKKLSSLSSRKL